MDVLEYTSVDLPPRSQIILQTYIQRDFLVYTDENGRRFIKAQKKQ